MNAAEIIDSVARAISRPEIQGAPGPQAKAAVLATLDAIREPSEVMTYEAMADTDFDFYDKRGQVEAVWRSMLDALKREIAG